MCIEGLVLGCLLAEADPNHEASEQGSRPGAGERPIEPSPIRPLREATRVPLLAWLLGSDSRHSPPRRPPTNRIA